MAKWSSSRCHCSVPLCSSDQQYQPYLSFHQFPTDPEQRARWVRAIRRDEGPHFRILPASTYMCSLHFTAEDIYTTPKGRRRLKRGTVPSKFAWTNLGYIPQPLSVSTSGSTSVSTSVSPSVSQAWKRLRLDTVNEPQEESAVFTSTDHDYAAPPPPDSSHRAAEDVKKLWSSALERKLQETTQIQLKLNHFCASDSDFRFYTHFPSEEAFMGFWECVSPSASRLMFWSKAQRMNGRPPQKMPLIYECFLFFCRVAAGLEPKVLSSRFGVDESTVTCITRTWTQYLYQVLGALPLWMSRAQVNTMMSDECRKCCPNVRVVIDSTEVHCETLRSEVLCSPQKHRTFRGLMGVAPSGVITFVSNLHPDSLSHRDLTEQSNLCGLLEPGDVVLADEGFQIQDLLEKVGAELIVPTLKTTPDLSREEAFRTQTLVHLKEQRDRAVQRVKDFHIWDCALPLSLSTTVNQLWSVCCLLSHCLHTHSDHTHSDHTHSDHTHSED